MIWKKKIINVTTFPCTLRCNRTPLVWIPESQYCVPAPAKDSPPCSAEIRLCHYEVENVECKS